MSQFESESPYANPDESPMGGMGGPPAGPTKTSGAAVGAIICSGIICCVPTTILGVILGLVALVSIGRNPNLRGKGLAITAIVLGLVATAFFGWLYYFVGTMTYESMQLMTKGPDLAMQRAVAGDIAGFKDSFHGAGATATDEEASAFLSALESRYGAYQSSSPAGQPPQPGVGQTSLPVPYDLLFDGGMVSAEVQLVFADPAVGPVMKLGYIHVTDPELGDLKYPPDGAN